MHKHAEKISIRTIYNNRVNCTKREDGTTTNFGKYLERKGIHSEDRIVSAQTQGRYMMCAVGADHTGATNTHRTHSLEREKTKCRREH